MADGRIRGWGRSKHAPAALLLAALVSVPLVVAAARMELAAELPDRLSDADFWKLAADISEPGGYFRITDNFTSNENEVGELFTALRQGGWSGGVYLGVGPEQNYSYIAAIKPQMAFILDIRRQAAIQHLLFKAVFELSKDRADFISLLFARPRPKNLKPDMPVAELWNAFLAVTTDQALAARNREQVINKLTAHKFSLDSEETSQLHAVMSAFVQYGPGISTRGSFTGRGGGNNWTFADLTGWSADVRGQAQSFLATEADFQTVKALHDKNLIVPVTGDFGGPKALRAIAAYLKARGATVTAFYVSNVEQYLFQDGKQFLFYDNVAELPITAKTVFIRPYGLRSYGSRAGLCGVTAFLKNVKDGRVMNNNAALACPQ